MATDHKAVRKKTIGYRLEENLGAAEVTQTAADLAEIETAAAAIVIEGERYPPHIITTTGL